MNIILIFYAVVACISGLVVGSFLNVVIHRMPRGQSLVFPSSHCPKCHHKIAFYDNIPVLSYLMLGGKCRKCHQTIDKIYPIIEFITGVLFLTIFLYRGNTLQYVLDIVLISIFICIFMIDLHHMIIPDQLNIALALVGVLPIIFGYISLTSAATGAVLGGSILFIIALIGPMGGGDIKFMAAMGLWLGSTGVLLALWISFVVGGMIGIIQLMTKMKQRGEKVAFGPYLIFGSVLAYFFKDIFLKYYFSLL